MATFDYYSDNANATLSGNWLKFEFGFTSDHIMVKNDNNTLSIESSHDGGARNFRYEPEESFTFDGKRRSSVYLRPFTVGTSGIEFRVSAGRNN